MGIGGIVSDWFGSKNEERAAGRQVRSDNYEYGGEQGGAAEAAYEAEARARAAANRGATQASNVDVNYKQANQDRALGQQARQGQSSLASIMQQRATGGGPSVAQMQADRQMGQLGAAQASLAGSARGAGGLAAAGRNAAFNTANGAADISGQAQIAAAQERRDDTNAAAGMFSNLRGGDLASQQQSAQQSLARTQNAVQQNQFNAGLRDSQAARNDAMQMGERQLGHSINQTQLGARTNYEAQQSANALGAQGINAGVGGQNANMNQSNAMNVMGFAQSAAGAASGGLIPGKARGGPVADAKPYLVGEEGPELIIPRRDGHVLTADETRQALDRSSVSGLVDRGNRATRNVSLSQLMGTRADGGPVQGEQGAPPMVTWGSGPGLDPAGLEWQHAQEQNERMAPYEGLERQIAEQRSGINATADRVNASVADIDSRDREAVWSADYKDRHGQQLSREEDDRATEARYRQSEDDKTKRGDAKKKRQRTLSELLGDSGRDQQRQAAAIDTAYHGGGGYAPPQLIPLAGARAGGGPIFAGLQPLNHGPRRPDEAAPMMGAGSGAAATSYEVMTPGGGMNVGASGQAHSDFATKYQHNPVASPMAYGGAREDGGPVEGEKDREARAKMPTPKYDYDPSRPFGERFVPRQQSDSALAPPSAPAAPAPLPQPARTYDASQPFGERFVPTPARQPTNFERTDPAKEQAAIEHEQAARTNATTAATSPSVGAAVPAIAAGVAHFLQSMLGRKDAKKSVPDEDEKKSGPRLAAIMRGK